MAAGFLIQLRRGNAKCTKCPPLCSTEYLTTPPKLRLFSVAKWHGSHRYILVKSCQRVQKEAFLMEAKADFCVFSVYIWALMIITSQNVHPSIAIELNQAIGCVNASSEEGEHNSPALRRKFALHNELKPSHFANSAAALHKCVSSTICLCN